VALLIDTDLLVDLERGDATSDVERLLNDEDRAISVITVSELLHGVHRAEGAIRVRRRAFVEHILADFEAIPITEPVARVHADIWSNLADRGQPVGAHDLWIAATALVHGLGVATRNSTHFKRIAGLRVITTLAEVR
jgi:tRNA(fMet)-specific endonuclease VapC